MGTADGKPIKRQSQDEEKMDMLTHTNVYRYLKSWDSSVGIWTGYQLDKRGSIPARDKIFLFSIGSRSALRPIQSLIQWVPKLLLGGNAAGLWS